ncbi:MAG: LysR family transcriptional regulator [Rhodobacteraceae bacterium]|nr:LysR family transcriptional regulator [Paracoccaceae bacterium]
MNNIKLQNLRFFVAVYEERSISAAARKVHATQSGVSVQVRDLEDQLGLSLFDRVSTGVTPTKAGDQIYRRAISILREVGRLGEDVSDMSDHLTGEVRVGIMPTFARSILAPVLSKFCLANPFVEVRATEGYSAFLIQKVLAGELDVAVVPDGVFPGGLRSTFLDRDLELLVSRQPLEGVEGAVDLANVPPLSLVLPGPINARRANIDQQLGNSTGVVHNILEMDSMMATLDIVRRGEWSSILPGCLCHPDLNDPDIHLYPIEHPKLTVDYLLIEPAAKVASTATRQFTEQLAEEIRRVCELCRNHFDKGQGSQSSG